MECDFLVGHHPNSDGLQRNTILGEARKNIQVCGASLALALNSPSKYKRCLLLITVLIQANLITLGQTGKENSQKVRYDRMLVCFLKKILRNP